MWCGSQWISDFKQKSYKIYSKNEPPIHYYRYQNCSDIEPNDPSDCQLSPEDLNNYEYCCYEELYYKECQSLIEEEYNRELIIYNFLKEIGTNPIFECNKKDNKLDNKIDKIKYNDSLSILLLKVYTDIKWKKSK